METEDYIKSN